MQVSVIICVKPTLHEYLIELIVQFVADYSALILDLPQPIAKALSSRYWFS